MVIDFIKKLYYKLPWGWTQKTPGEVWFALSILFGIAVAILVYWDNFFGAGATLSDGLSATVYGLVSGAGSKFINSIASSAGVKLKAAKEEAQAKIQAVTNGKKEEPILEEAFEDVSPMPDYSLDERIEKTKKRVEEKLLQDAEPVVEVVKKLAPEGDYVIINGEVYKITKKEQ